MTVQRRDGSHESPYLEWIRQEKHLDSRDFNITITDNDHWHHQYSTRREARGKTYPFDSLMLIEVKTFNKLLPFSQNDTLDIVNILLRRSSIINNRRKMVKIEDRRPGRTGCFRHVRCFGRHVLTLSEERPDYSSQILWDNIPIKYDDLISLYLFEKDPDSPNRLLDTRRHHLRPQRESHPELPLFDMFDAA